MIVHLECVTAKCDGIRPDGRPCRRDLDDGFEWYGFTMDALVEELSDAGWLALPDGRHLCGECVDEWRYICDLIVGRDS